MMVQAPRRETYIVVFLNFSLMEKSIFVRISADYIDFFFFVIFWLSQISFKCDKLIIIF